MFDKTYLLPREALTILLNALSTSSPSVEVTPIEECYARIIAREIISPEDLPAFDRSTVDGYAVNSEDTFGAKENSPAYITVTNEVTMGTAPVFRLSRGEAAKIPTGGMLPEGADAVVMLEHTQTVSEDMVEVLRSVAHHENVIIRGEDVAEHEIVLKKGHKLRAQDIGALAGLGLTEIEVFKKPVVAVISTGDEIVPPGMPLGLGQVRDINSFTLWGLIRDCGGVPVKKGIFRDIYEVIRGAVERALEDSDMVLICGGTSAGTKDVTAKIIDDIGQPGVLFHGVSVKPGKPLIGGVIRNKPVLGLPGHPAATVVSFDLFIRPLIEKLGGLASHKFSVKTVQARMAKSIASAAGRQDHIRVYLEEKDDGCLAVPVLGKSGLITTLVKADGIVVISQDRLGLDAGQEVTVVMF